MKKCILNTSLSALVATLIAVILGFVGDTNFFAGITSLWDVSVFPTYWYLMIAPGLLVVLFLLSLVFKIRRFEKNFVQQFTALVVIAGYMLFVPKAFLELLDSVTIPTSLLFTTGAAIVVLATVTMVIILICDTAKSKRKEEKVEEVFVEEAVAPEVVVVEEPVAKVGAQVEFLDEEVEDEEDMEVESAEEAEARKEDNKKSKDASESKKAVKVKEEKEVDKEFDRIYHIMKRAKDDRWIVKIAQSRKAIKIFDTQREAIAYAEVLASNNNGVVRIFASKGANKGRIIT